MACCMFAAFIVGHIVLMWRTLLERWFPERALARAARATASAWRPGMSVQPIAVTPRRRWLSRSVGGALIAVSLVYFAVQAKSAWQQASDAESFALILAQNICHVSLATGAQRPIQIVADNRK